jgi:GNAT superfamily N-acetyltransferase
MIQIKEISQEHISQVSNIHKEVFPRQWHSQEWIQSNFNAYPRIMMYVALIENQTVWYIGWIQKSGSRDEVVLELEQIWVSQSCQWKGIWQELIKKSLKWVEKKLQERNAKIKTLYVTTRTDNKAQEIYKKVLWVKEVGVIKDLYSSDEVFLGTNNI